MSEMTRGHHRHVEKGKKEEKKWMRSLMQLLNK